MGRGAVADNGPDCISWMSCLKGIVRNGQIINNRLGDQVLRVDTKVMMSMAANNKWEANAALCAPAAVVPMPSVAYRLARVAAGDAIACASLAPVSAHDIEAGHALLIGTGGVLLDQLGRSIKYDSINRLLRPSLRYFGGAPQACKVPVPRDWNSLFRAT